MHAIRKSFLAKKQTGFSNILSRLSRATYCAPTSIHRSMTSVGSNTSGNADSSNVGRMNIMDAIGITKIDDVTFSCNELWKPAVSRGAFGKFSHF
ncbi:hypothetical protein AYI69_g6042 [Smittium culicis]|uniref:Uncharacterized protein n=1 Tax=Smittium culicis TaxID=133412 RepID=A0A1R1WZQ7_9FUNG|nr:hypothetical protein AYI69_g11550 [Smittium culicis]OMJ07855.1 hypothetical protein AYI69_g11301 [Smittium culicis]OMJ20920.1 hypothetical protein AYI69_g6042 [Smittium culicis]